MAVKKRPISAEQGMVNRSRGWVPDASLGRVRLVATVISALGLAGQTTAIGGATGVDAWDNAGRVALVALGGIVLSTYVRDRAWPWEPVVTPLFCVGAGSAMADSVSVVGLIIGMLLVQSLYGSRRAWAVRSIGGVFAVPAVLYLSPSPEQNLSFDAPGALSVIPQITLTAVIARMISSALQRQQFITARDALLAQAGARLLAASDTASVYRIAREAAAELVALAPGTVVLVGVPDPGGVLITGCIGPIGDRTGQVLPLEALAEPAATLDGFADWHIEELAHGRHRLIGHPRRVSGSVVEAFRTLTRQVELSEANLRSHAELDRRANHDHLTQLPNRAKFFAELAVAVDRGPDGTVALLNIDLDDFKQVNDTFGHAAGDELLVQVAERLTAAAGDRGVAARFGGDEFALLLTGVRDVADAEQVAAGLCGQLCEQQRLATATVLVGASIGVAVHEPGVTAAALTRRADIAMYSAKARGKSRVETYHAGQHGEMARHRTLEDQLPYAIERGELIIALQPYADLRTGAWLGVEALFQWRHPQMGDVTCRELLDVAERIGAVHDITRHILGVLCARMTDLPGLPVGLNISARQLLDPRFGDTVLGALAAGAMPPDRLVLEVAESEQVDDPVTGDQLRRLAAAGVRIALDDFGTGHVSLATLRSFPIHQIKADASFGNGDPGALELVLSLADLLGAITIVQGVTSDAQASTLRGTTATAAQGPFVGPPVPVDQLAAVSAA